MLESSSTCAQIVPTCMGTRHAWVLPEVRVADHSTKRYCCRSTRSSFGGTLYIPVRSTHWLPLLTNIWYVGQFDKPWRTTWYVGRQWIWSYSTHMCSSIPIGGVLLFLVMYRVPGTSCVYALVRVSIEPVVPDNGYRLAPSLIYCSANISCCTCPGYSSQ